MRNIITTKIFDKAFLKISERNEILQKEILIAIRLLELDVKNPKLKTHKLSGNLKDFSACRVNYSIRILFKFDDENVYLETVGTHDDVY